MTGRAWARLSVAIALAAGAGLFAIPFVFPAVTEPGAGALAGAAAVMVVASLLAAALEGTTRQVGTAALALLATLVALDCALRAVTITGIGGYSAVFLLIIVGGYAMGPCFGFAQGILALLVSSVVTGGVGPWVPYEAYAAGLVGWASGVAGLGRPASRVPGWPELVTLALVGAFLGYAYGAIMDVWDTQYFTTQLPGAGSFADRFAAYYMATSFAWDSFRAIGNAAMVLVLGRPLIGALRRFRLRLDAAFV
ncbi:MAG: hypothetical protein ACYDAY_10120 [Candidatus Dormibacteria bacterium]